VMPDGGPVYGGTLVTITGLGFLNNNYVYDVYFGGEYADFQVISDTEIRAISPQCYNCDGYGGYTVEIEVNTDWGSAYAYFTYYYPPVVPAQARTE